MTGLVLKLSPKERVLINGAVIENGDKRAKINIITPNANILRLRDALHPKDINSPVKRVCYILQLVLSGDVDDKAAKDQVLDGIRQLSHVFDDDAGVGILESTRLHVESDQFYKALRCIRGLLDHEAQLMRAAG